MKYGTLKSLVLSQSDYKRFWDKVIIRGEDDCWYWGNFSTEKTGYGRFQVQGRVFHSSQVALALSGTDIKQGDNVLHSKQCVLTAVEVFGDGSRSRLCCNPAHLRIGTQKENSQDTKELGRMKGLFDGSKYNYGETHPFAKLSSVEVVAIQSDNRTHNAIAKQYGVAQSTISRIKNNTRRKLG